MKLVYGDRRRVPRPRRRGNDEARRRHIGIAKKRRQRSGAGGAKARYPRLVGRHAQAQARTKSKKIEEAATADAEWHQGLALEERQCIQADLDARQVAPRIDQPNRNYQWFLGEASMLGARPGLSCSGEGAVFSAGNGRDLVVARSVVIAGMHPGRRVGGPFMTSESRGLNGRESRDWNQGSAFGADGVLDRHFVCRHARRRGECLEAHSQSRRVSAPAEPG